MREWLSWWSTTLPRSGSRVRVPSRALAMKIAYAAVAQSVERRIGSAEVTGPIPVSSFIEKKRKSLNERVCAFLCYGVTVLRYYDECIVMEVWMRGGIYG